MHPTPNGFVPKENGVANDAHKDSFLTYFFGGANKNERPALGPQETVNNASFSAPVSVTSMMESELERKFEQASLNTNDEELQASEREEIEIQLIRKHHHCGFCFSFLKRSGRADKILLGTLITSYFNIVRKNIQDLVPKAIMHLLVNHSRESIQNRLVASLYKEELFKELLQEDEGVAAEREKCKTLLDVYKQAFEIVNSAV